MTYKAMSIWTSIKWNVYLKNWFKLFQAANSFRSPSNDAILFNFQISTVSRFQCDVSLVYRQSGKYFFGLWAITLICMETEQKDIKIEIIFHCWLLKQHPSLAYLHYAVGQEWTSHYPNFWYMFACQIEWQPIQWYLQILLFATNHHAFVHLHLQSIAFFHLYPSYLCAYACVSLLFAKRKKKKKGNDFLFTINIDTKMVNS